MEEDEEKIVVDKGGGGEKDIRTNSIKHTLKSYCKSLKCI